MITKSPRNYLDVRWAKFSGPYSNILNFIGLHGKFHYTRLVHPLECHKWSAGTRLRSLCAVGDATTVAANAILVESQWQHREWSFPLRCTHPLPNTRLDRSHVPFFRSSVWPNRDSIQPTNICGARSIPRPVIPLKNRLATVVTLTLSSHNFPTDRARELFKPFEEQVS